MKKDAEGMERDVLKGAREEKSAALSEYIQFILLFEQI